ncbi:MAG: dihydrofolate reductase family protein [Aquamicrobium sp.]|jgi:dihydrofolate reductase|uniref:dihydrofolate reductase family protein n=1 Tax=Mesorhizobium sp. Pch-S TaxID=2082387 RepID=UPI00101198B2|nr:dihydrofolate reductase family protein [Mesorhizobium sp. Pch-S]MBR2690630.1 dihydrofolate reductase family protein [Aquamicrobium sp.]QAZ43241.1 dihydrofolate reductase [Mesorhizobium sp. Pch-S]
MRKIIAALQISLDGFIEGPQGELDWITGWEDEFEVTPEIDACILGGGMYPGYEQYWTSIIANPDGVLELTGRPATQGERNYARFAARTPHFVVSRTLKATQWDVAQIVGDLDEIAKLKDRPGKNMHLVGGATLVSSMVEAGLVDELRLVVIPIILGAGKALFKDVRHRHALTLEAADRLKSGNVRLIYRVGPH